MEESTIKTIFEVFDHRSNYLSYSELNTGHINDTFFVNTDLGNKYIL